MEAVETLIPTIPGLPIIGNLHQIPKGKSKQHLLKISRTFPDGVFTLRFGPRETLFVFNPDLVAELCDEGRFRKLPGAGLRILRVAGGDGLFTAFSDEPNWGKAHRLLMPAFSQRAMRGYFDMILEVIEQLAAKWTDREGQDLLVSDDMTRLTLDSIAVCGFGERFRSFDAEALHPFLTSMGDVLEAVMVAAAQLPVQRALARGAKQRLAENVAAMNNFVDGIVAARQKGETHGSDLLSLMLTAIDPETGERLDPVNIRYQVNTFLIAGHETTSGLLTFALYLLLRHPSAMAQAYAEVDRVLPGDARLAYGDIPKLEVIDRVLKESLRLWPTAPGFSVAPFDDTMLGGRHPITKDRQVNIPLTALHRNPKVWADPERFDIDRWTPEAEATHHPHAYKPFGNGLRACIGRQFAIMEAKMALAVILQKFALSDPHDYQLDIRESLTIKPDGFRLRARPRHARERLSFGAASEPEEQSAVVPVAGAGRRMHLLYGSSLGTARDVAEQIAALAEKAGFATSVAALDGGLEAVAADSVVLVVTATYNGRAPDSAVGLESAIAAGALPDIPWPRLRFAVLGIGNSQWPNYQAFPRLLDTTFAAQGAQRLIDPGAADGSGDFDGAVDAFITALWPALGGAPVDEPAERLDVVVVDPAEMRLARVAPQARLFKVVESRELVSDPAGLWDFSIEPPRTSTRHVSLALPDGESYQTGDHFAVYASNRPALVDRALARLDVGADTIVRLDGVGARQRHLPIGETLTARSLLADFIDLQEPITRRVLGAVIQHVRCPNTLATLRGLLDSDAEAGGPLQRDILDRRVTLLDLLELYPAIELGLADVVRLSPSVQPRFYSIASSPLVQPDRADLLVGTVSAPAWSGLGSHEGFASTFLRDVRPGTLVTGYVRTPSPAFAPPSEPRIPLILIGPGTGFAPFRGFLQERSAQRAEGTAVGRIQLFFGCRHRDHDWFHREEMEAWANDGLLDLHVAFSAEGGERRFVQDALWAARSAVWASIEAGAMIYVCGDGRYMAPAVRDTLVRMHMDHSASNHADASSWLEAMIDGGRYHQDVFGFGK